MRTSLFVAALGVCAAGLISTGAIAQPFEGVTVRATRSVDVKLVGKTSSGIPIKDVSLGFRVSTADLDLASAAGAEELEKRINDAALAVCKEIGRQYPKSRPGDKECAQMTAKKAMVKAHELVHAAGKASTQ